METAPVALGVSPEPDCAGAGADAGGVAEAAGGEAGRPRVPVGEEVVAGAGRVGGGVVGSEDWEVDAALVVALEPAGREGGGVGRSSDLAMASLPRSWMAMLRPSQARTAGGGRHSTEDGRREVGGGCVRRH